MADGTGALVNGLDIRSISKEDFCDFAEHHARSEEVGPIRVFFEHDPEQLEGKRPFLLGLYGCGVLCAATCCVVALAKRGDSSVCKLDSVIVHKDLRRRGLATTIVTRAFLDILADAQFELSMFYAHSVHPGTEKLLRALTFNDPPPTGAPISSLHFDGGTRPRFESVCKSRFDGASNYLRVQCAYCLGKNKRARRWCTASRQ